MAMPSRPSGAIVSTAFGAGSLNQTERVLPPATVHLGSLLRVVLRTGPPFTATARSARMPGPATTPGVRRSSAAGVTGTLSLPQRTVRADRAASSRHMISATPSKAMTALIPGGRVVMDGPLLGALSWGPCRLCSERDRLGMC